jgi:uncharacterized membrane protein YdfJ with MMPL/SSD domain
MILDFLIDLLPFKLQWAITGLLVAVIAALGVAYLIFYA